MNFSASVIAMLFPLGNLVHGAVPVKFYYDMQERWPAVPGPRGFFNECAREHASGIGQSPINIHRTNTCSAVNDGYKFYVGDCSVDDYSFTISDHGMKAEIVGTTCAKPSMIIPGNPNFYEVLQLHIHTGCEHNMDGAGCDAELHIVHAAKQSLTAAASVDASTLPDLAVVGIMLNGGDNHEEAIDPLLDRWASVSCADGCDADKQFEHGAKALNPYSLLPSGTDFYKYIGGLTTPPCWEVVNWNVAASALTVSWRQILALSNLVNYYAGHRNVNGVCVADRTVASAAGLTGRDVQPLLGRQVQKVCEPYTMSKRVPTMEITRADDTGKDITDEASADVELVDTPVSSVDMQSEESDGVEMQGESEAGTSSAIRKTVVAVLHVTTLVTAIQLLF